MQKVIIITNECRNSFKDKLFNLIKSILLPQDNIDYHLKFNSDGDIELKNNLIKICDLDGGIHELTTTDEDRVCIFSPKSGEQIFKFHEAGKDSTDTDIIIDTYFNIDSMDSILCRDTIDTILVSCGVVIRPVYKSRYSMTIETDFIL